jgi:hypothetical protein
MNQGAAMVAAKPEEPRRCLGASLSGRWGGREKHPGRHAYHSLSVAIFATFYKTEAICHSPVK